ncbi:DUF3307 domain-containing protein [Salinivibrio costicola]|uniref:DUF3307 domain-containing protein n=1 Tax=Salinivibrio costicola TaxID=51367 RepID=A0ABX6K8Y8_SALCS|nr:DUF3307 domain-containing protein [Salinivibrio costicola]QIR07992.1 DUF3307 domain-containing protein [Salinivibrio costicola]
MMAFLSLLVPLLLTHLIYDFYLQPTNWWTKSTPRARIMDWAVGPLLYGLCLLVPTVFWTQNVSPLLGVLAVGMITKRVVAVLDGQLVAQSSLARFTVSQGIHLLVLGLIALSFVAQPPWVGLTEMPLFSEIVVIGTGYLLILKPTSVLIGHVLQRFTITLDSPSDHQHDYHGLVAAGALIGYLERILILTFTLLGSYTAVGFVLAAKSIFRFGELTRSADRSLTEYVLIGSLLSVVITTLVGVVITQSLTLL